VLLATVKPTRLGTTGPHAVPHRDGNPGKSCMTRQPWDGCRPCTGVRRTRPGRAALGGNRGGVSSYLADVALGLIVFDNPVNRI
jgi:hypothetical protein